MGHKDVDIPSGKAPEDYTYHERRAELLQAAIEAGHPDMLNRTRFADRYDVDPSTVTRDIQALQEEIHDDLSTDAEFVTATIYRRAIREKADKGEWMEAVELVESWNEWLYDTGQQEKAPDKMEMDMDLDASIETDERKALIGVDLTEFAGVDPDQMVGLDLDDVADEDVPDELDGEAADIPLVDDEEAGDNGDQADE